ncbi:lipolytic protein G-D-S-L family [Paenibacillus curdlanolyticus YK9]|uniref:Lipolytic protein G-D-S-L family n=1 Tax=Paenibacillus curdlanolyticus YK9 TaxID=717606 RepID=E0IFN2_9BACL|nr:SGNH/GDSL hydrolase family protein [Paenibacillus curdlanolyticus]EFM08698.1 lipolytic protein G-D-S-L family [Paenibacillus curdlanolyticus YK9]
MLFEAKDKIVLIGDSITDCGRALPIGEAGNGDAGNGYVELVDAFLQSAYPELKLRLVNVGISGNTVRDLKKRWETDVIEQKPNWLTIMIGTNDVWRQFDRPAIPEWHVYIDEYERTLEELVIRTKPLVKGIVLMTPFFVEACRDDQMRAAMDQYGAVVRAIAERQGTLFVDTQAAFDGVLEKAYSAQLTWDRVHPNKAGHLVLARALLDAVGFDYAKRA